MSSDLDCLFCSEEFPTFQALSEHVKRAHSLTRDGDVISEIGRAFDAAQETDPMALPKPTAPARTERRERGQRAERRDFLKAAHIGKPGTRATIQLAGNVKIVEGNFGDQVVVNCEYDGKPYVFATNIDTPNYTLLVSRFSDDETKWFGALDLIVKDGVSSAYLIVADDQEGAEAIEPATRGRKRR